MKRNLKSPQYEPGSQLERMVRESTLGELYSNPTVGTDFYKYTHPRQFPNELQEIMTYGEARTGGKYPQICNLGLQIVLNEDFMNTANARQLAITRAHVLSAGGFDYFEYDVWDKVRKLGYLPIEICSLPEGLIVPEGTPLFTTRATEPWFVRSANLLEGTLMHAWAPITIASRLLQIKKRLIPLFEKTGSMSSLRYALLDFSYRSASCDKEAVRKGAPHLFFFDGSDNMIADEIGIMYHYSGPQVLKSVWATEHTVSQSFGRGNEAEKQYLLHQLREAPIDAIVSSLIDTYNSRNFMETIVSDAEVVTEIKKRAAHGGRTVFRPDSKDMKKEVAMVFHFLEQIFGSTVRDDYRIFNSSTGAIAADGINEDSGVELYEHIINEGYACENLVQGSGKGIFSGVDRDTSCFAIKANNAVFSDRGDTPLIKDPAGCTFKRSKPGHIHVYRENGAIKTITSTDPLYEATKAKTKNLLQPKLRNGEMLIDERYPEVKARIDEYLFGPAEKTEVVS